MLALETNCIMKSFIAVQTAHRVVLKDCTFNSEYHEHQLFGLAMCLTKAVVAVDSSP